MTSDCRRDTVCSSNWSHGSSLTIFTRPITLSCIFHYSYEKTLRSRQCTYRSKPNCNEDDSREHDESLENRGWNTYVYESFEGLSGVTGTLTIPLTALFILSAVNWFGVDVSTIPAYAFLALFTNNKARIQFLIVIHSLSPSRRSSHDVWSFARVFWREISNLPDPCFTREFTRYEPSLVSGRWVIFAQRTLSTSGLT